MAKIHSKESPTLARHSELSERSTVKLGGHLENCGGFTDFPEAACRRPAQLPHQESGCLIVWILEACDLPTYVK